MIHFKESYGQSCNTPISQSDPVNRVLIRPDMLRYMEQEMQLIKKNLEAAEDRKKKYANQNRLFKGFHVGEHVYLHIKPKKITFQIGSCTKLAPQFYRPFSIVERIRPISYQLSLPLIVKLHDVFHLSLLNKYLKHVDHVNGCYVLQVEPNGEFHLKPQCILHKKVLMLRNGSNEQVKVQSKKFGPNKATWEMLDEMEAMHPSLFVG